MMAAAWILLAIAAMLFASIVFISVRLTFLLVPVTVAENRI